MGRYHFIFPRWSNLLLPAIILLALTGPPYVAVMIAFGFSPETTDVGYQPQQPVPFSHKLHAGELGIDCRYCHNTVEFTAKASIPPTQTCMNCHLQLHPESPKLAPLFESYRTGMPVEWIRVHDLPDFAYFNHAAHVTRGVSCVECHGRIDTMETVYQVKPLSMKWCLGCHREPAPHLRDPSLVTQLEWGWAMTDAERLANGTDWARINQLQPSQDCSTCHR